MRLLAEARTYSPGNPDLRQRHCRELGSNQGIDGRRKAKSGRTVNCSTTGSLTAISKLGAAFPLAWTETVLSEHGSRCFGVDASTKTTPPATCPPRQTQSRDQARIEAVIDGLCPNLQRINPNDPPGLPGCRTIRTMFGAVLHRCPSLPRQCRCARESHPPILNARARCEPFSTPR